MSEPSLSPAADRSRWPSCPSSGRRRAARALTALLGLALLAGCTPATADPPGAVHSGTSTTRTSTPAASAPSTPAAAPDTAKVLARLAKVSRTGIGTSGVSVLTDSGATVAGRKADLPLAPASNLKLLTTLAALDALGAEHTFSTTVVSPGKGRLVLVGGGDPLLTDKASTSAAKPASL